MSLLSSISSWVKKIVQPVVSTVSSWFAPKPAAPKAATTYTPAPYKPAPVSPAAVRAAVTSPGTTWSVAAPTSYQAAQPTTADYLKRKAEAEAVTSWLRTSPTQAYVPGKGYVPYQTGLTPSYQEQLDRVAALKSQYSWLGKGTEVTPGTTPIGQMPTQQPISQVTTRQPTIFDTIKSWFSPQQPVLAETWQKPAQEVFGQSQQGQSLLGSLQDWMGKAGRAFQEPFTSPLTPSVAQAQGPTEPGRLEDITAEEWGKMGRPPGGQYPPLGPMAEAKTGLPTYIPPGTYKKEDKPWWEGGTSLVVPTPEQFNTPEYAKGYFNTFLNPEINPAYFTSGKLNTEGTAALEDAWDAFTSDAKEGYYTPEQIGKDPEIHEVTVTEMLMRDKYDQKWVETLQDTSLGKVITQVASQDPTKLPPEISQERLDAMVRGPDFATLYDTGYRSQAYQEEVTAGIQQIQSNGAQITYDPVSLNSLTYANIEGLKSQLAQISPAQWQTIVEGNAQITLKTEFWKFNAKGETINKGSWDIDYPPQSEMKQSEKDRYIDQQQFYNDWYWSDEATAQRQKEREESYEYYHEKDLEGWKEYYAILDGMKLYPDASEYWSQAGKFAELRRKWETSGSGMTWDVWLQQFDFEGEWYALPPQERGEKPYIYSPRMIRLNY